MRFKRCLEESVAWEQSPDQQVIRARYKGGNEYDGLVE